MPIEVKQIPSEAISLLSKNLLLPLSPTESPQKNTQAFSCNKGPKIAFSGAFRKDANVSPYMSTFSARGGHSLVSSVPMRDQRIVEHTLNSVIDI